MKISKIATTACAAAAVIAAVTTPAGAPRATASAAAEAQPGATVVITAATGRGTQRMRAACGPARPGRARCLALYAPQAAVNAAITARAAGRRVPAAAATPKGWGATDIESAYKLPVSGNPHQTVAVVDAMSTPHLAADLAVYRKQYKLPACTTASGCLRIVNQQGKTAPLPRPDPAAAAARSARVG